ncbi:aminotransferase class I and II [Chloroherpeton thalassium ATCC 35110]|uniref:Aminotransferase n=1 Tax=Chloroherpeton thalassium (strain ATCC 35110 / GB-78) TaxID=517418 RepID=B3QZ44_CHLT3|nr:aminotransferase class I/II-fold pyridoxal phosphate-dependent enzyme [Chloroherpeton thalassium]ACF13737.1 aminotransferase class I and II [Chloroherpeton thalassium ATCC 35110]
MLHGHGDDAYQFTHPISANFSSNVWAGGSPEGLKAHLFEKWDAVHRYPEVTGESLQALLAEHHGVAPEQVLVTNGAVEAIYLIAQRFRNARTLIFTPAFSEYEDACRLHSHDLQFASHEAFSNETFSLPPETKLCFICNPNNPTGQLHPREKLARLFEANPNTHFVTDEAFTEFTADPNASLAPLLRRYPNLTLLRSMTKIFAVPGLRLGYALASAEQIAALSSHKQPWTVNALAIEAGKYLIERLPETLPDVAGLLRRAAAFKAALQTVPGLSVSESAVHFFLCELKIGRAADLKKHLAETHGLLVRDASNFRGCRAGHFRLATLSDAENARLINALQAWIQTCS